MYIPHNILSVYGIHISIYKGIHVLYLYTYKVRSHTYMYVVVIMIE